MEVVGRRGYEMKNDDGVYTGVTLHCIEAGPTPESGRLCVKVSIGTRKPGYEKACSVPFGSVITPVYNRFGKTEDIIINSTPDKK